MSIDDVLAYFKLTSKDLVEVSFPTIEPVRDPAI